MSRADLRGLLLGLVPLGSLVILSVAVPGSWDAIGANPPAILGLPLGIVVVGIALGLMVLGLVALARASSERSTLLAFVGLTLPSTILMAAAPVLVLLIQTIGQ